MADRNLSTLLGGGGRFIADGPAIIETGESTSATFTEITNVSGEQTNLYQALLVVSSSNPATVGEMRITRNGTALNVLQFTGGTVGGNQTAVFFGNAVSGTASAQTESLYSSDSLLIEIRRVSGTATIRANILYQTGTVE